VFTEKVRTRAVACKQMNMVTPIHLLLFGAKKIDFSNGFVQIDNWINLKMDVKSASAIVALRPAIECLIVHASEEPESISSLNEADTKLLDVLKQLCSFNSGRYNLSPILFDQGKPIYKRAFNETSSDAPNSKLQCNDRNYFNQGTGGYQGNYSSYSGGYNTRGYGSFPGRGPSRFRGNYYNRNNRGFNRRF
jgi:ATP-dependent RNA helicase A